MASLLRDTGHFSTKFLTKKLAHNYCRLVGARDQIKDSFAIDTHHIRVAPKPPSKTRAIFQKLKGSIKIIQPKNLKKDDISAQRSGASFESWIPLVMKPLFQILLCLLPVALITTLTVLLIRVDRSKGIVDLPLDNPNVHYGWTLLPTAIFFGITVMYGMLDTAIQTLQPFQNLSDGQTAHESTTYTKDCGGMIPIRAFLYAFRHGHLAMMATTLTTLCAPFFPVVINGLFRYACYDSLAFRIRPRRFT